MRDPNVYQTVLDETVDGSPCRQPNRLIVLGRGA